MVYDRKLESEKDANYNFSVTNLTVSMLVAQAK